MSTTEPLDRLIGVCVDAEKRYHHAASDVGRADLEKYFERQAVARKKAADELNRERIRLGGDDKEAGTFGGLIDRTAMDFSVIMSAGDSAVVDWCRSDAQSVVAEYERALALNLPPGTREIVARQLAEIRLTATSLEKELQAYGGRRS
ncbi:MAG TPA: PA2169 family four-helix-bundle protein [Candidatus Binataceae bacterium]|nr:PA2169 family four-helix-bundle protein [Candidatus Binataceae bacterium]